MKDINEVLKDKRVIAIFRNIQNEKAIQVKLNIKLDNSDEIALVKFTRAVGWEHLCASYNNRTPSWDEMNQFKEMFWKDNEVCFQLHPAKENYINNHEYSLHIWRSCEKEIDLPPTILVGFREGKEEEDAEALKQLQIELGNPISDEKIKFMQLVCSNPEKATKEISKLSLVDLLKLL